MASLLQYCKIRGDQPGLLFCQSDNRPISVHQFNSQLRRCLAFCGLDPRRYKSHRFRIGAACHRAEKGFSDAQIRALGRWKSDAFKLYIRNSTLIPVWVRHGLPNTVIYSKVHVVRYSPATIYVFSLYLV